LPPPPLSLFLSLSLSLWLCQLLLSPSAYRALGEYCDSTFISHSLQFSLPLCFIPIPSLSPSPPASPFESTYLSPLSSSEEWGHREMTALLSLSLSLSPRRYHLLRGTP